MNTPYVKQYNELGELINRIDGNLRHKFPNRRARRKRTERDFNNAKSFHLVVVKTQKFRKRFQFIGDKRILHYDEKY
jgi:hypothetical protein